MSNAMEERAGHQARWKTTGMTLVELLVVLAILALTTAAVYLPFKGQFWSYTRESELQSAQDVVQHALVLLQRDLLTAGYGVDKKLAFYIEDGGDNNPDALYVNDWSFLDEDELLSGIFGQARIEAFYDNNTRIELDTIDIDSDNRTEFKENISQTLITDTLNPGRKAALIDNCTTNIVELDRAVDGNYVVPAVWYCIADGALKRSDRSTGGRQPLAEGVVDLQIAYRNKSGTWFCDGIGTCPAASFDPQDLDQIRITLVARTKPVRGGVSPNPVKAENGPTWNDSRFLYRKYTAIVRPRNIQ